MGAIDGEMRRQQLQTFADKISKDYQHYADLASYATGRYSGEYEMLVGQRDHTWWTFFMDECIAKRDALASVIKDMRTILGVQVSTHLGDWTKGMEIYIKEFVLEGSEQTFDEYVAACGIDWTRDVGDFVERDPQ